MQILLQKTWLNKRICLARSCGLPLCSTFLRHLLPHTDLLIDGETIARIADRIDAPENCEIIDASGKLVFPGFIDAHTHFDLHVAGTVTIDDFYSGTKAEVAGGTTTIVDFGTAYPGETLNEGLDNWFENQYK